ncbi:MAG: capsular polysaccharide synthesis protein [Candidatus Saccharibacteria bacterium]|nr:capsular polysaccharide synthesis protein [Candidatus Saccharibacteria bacterium]
MSKLINKIKRKARWISVNHSKTYKSSDKLTEARLDEKYYFYFKKKYQLFLENLPKYKSSHKYSNKVWWCWLQGEENAPELCKACLASVRKNLKDREVIVITEDNFSDYVQLPDFVLNKYRRGLITRTQLSDILRLELLIAHGGTWIDSSVLVTDYDKEFFDKDLFVFKCFLKDSEGISASSWFISSEIDSPILHTTRDLLYEYLKKNDEFDRYYLLHIFFAIAAEKYPNIWKSVPVYPNAIPHILQFEIADEYNEERFKKICSLISIHKLTQKIDAKSFKKNSIYYHIVEQYKAK